MERNLQLLKGKFRLAQKSNVSRAQERTLWSHIRYMWATWVELMLSKWGALCIHDIVQVQRFYIYKITFQAFSNQWTCDIQVSEYFKHWISTISANKITADAYHSVKSLSLKYTICQWKTTREKHIMTIKSLAIY